jgi:hypothetical protein
MAVMVSERGGFEKVKSRGREGERGEGVPVAPGRAGFVVVGWG